MSIRTGVTTFWIVAGLIVQASAQSTSTGGIAALESARDADGAADFQRDLTEYQVFRQPTPPIALSGMIPEWASAKCLVLAIPEQSVLVEEQLETLLEATEQALDVTDVALLTDITSAVGREILFRELDKRNLLQNLASLYTQGAGANAARKPGRIHVLSASVDTIWARDWGPVFGLATDGRACLIDSMYQDVRKQARIEAALSESEVKSGGFKRWQDDMVPTAISTAFGQQGLLPGQFAIVRPPLQLWGGDFAVDSHGNGFTSTETLIMNGSDEETMTRRLREYFGLKSMTYLEPLPGDTIKHIDMFFRLVDDDTALLAEYPPVPPASSPQYRFLHAEVQRVLEQNLTVLRPKFRRIIRVPMPPLEFGSEFDVALKNALLRLQGSRVPHEHWLAIETHPSPQSSEPFDQLLAGISEFAPKPATSEVEEAQTALKSFDDVEKFLEETDRPEPAQLAEALKVIRGLSDYEFRRIGTERLGSVFTSLNEGFKSAQAPHIYRTYLNAVHLRGKHGEKVLVPEYRRQRRWEGRVRQAYQEAYPHADIAFIRCDELAEMYGALHCISFVIPDFEDTSTSGAPATSPAESRSRTTGRTIPCNP